MMKLYILSLLIIVSQINFSLSQKDLFDETQYKYMKLKNRVFKAAIADCESWDNGKLTDKMFKRYEELSKNEVGTIITGGILVEPWDNLPLISIEKDEYIPQYKKLADIVHKNGANIIGQVSAMKDLDLSKEEIHHLINLYGETALRLKKAGFDGVEIAANHFSLLSQFLSPIFNHRNDEYGGNNENRARFTIEVIKKIREMVGNEYILILKINSEDNDPNGITPEGFITACTLAEQAGIDMIEVSGMKWKVNKENKLVYFDIGKKLAEILNIPIIVTGGAKDLNVINDALNNSKIQYIGICRALLSEPDILIKWKNCEDKKSQCVSCMNCYKIDINREPECIINTRKRKKNLGKKN